jgi:hypothetical protein
MQNEMPSQHSVVLNKENIWITKRVSTHSKKKRLEKTITDANRIALAKDKGLDEAKFSQCLSARVYEKQVESDMALGEVK